MVRVSTDFVQSKHPFKHRLSVEQTIVPGECQQNGDVIDSLG